MYCVTCGRRLHSQNQAGLVCLPCKQAREKKRRRGEERPISICYCFHCGESYQPHDTSIQHLFCPSEKGCPTHSNVLLPEQEIISEARKDTDVWLSLVFSAQETNLI